MRHKQVFETLQNATEEKITPAIIANILGIKNVDTIRRRSSRNSEYTMGELMKLDRAYGTKLVDDEALNKGISGDVDDFSKDFVADYYSEVFGSCGNGYFVFSSEKELISIPKKIVPAYSACRNYSVINAIGDSMYPYINDKDKLIVEHFENGDMIKDNRVYVFCYENQIYVKRLIKNIDHLIIKSDNPDPVYSPRIIQGEDINNIDIIGRIVGLMRNMD